MEKASAYYGKLSDTEAILEMAQASGLPMVPEELRNPLHTTTYGTGELVRAALASKFATLGSLNVEPPRNAFEAQGLIDTLFACDNAELTAGGKKITALVNIEDLEKKFL